MSVFGWIFIMQRTGNLYSWVQTWLSYRNGFGSAAQDFWLGLERVHQLTQSGKYRLRFELLISGSWSSAEYWYFVVGDEINTQYRINVNGSV
jgi:ficolin